MERNRGCVLLIQSAIIAPSLDAFGVAQNWLRIMCCQLLLYIMERKRLYLVLAQLWQDSVSTHVHMSSSALNNCIGENVCYWQV
jgi:hypothetical protein